MFNWLQHFTRFLRAPVRATRELAEARVTLMESALGALLAQLLFSLYIEWPYMAARVNHPAAWFGLFAVTVASLLFVALVMFPAQIFVANLLDRHRSFSDMLRQEYATVAVAIFYAWAAAHVVALPLAALARATGYEAMVIAQTVASVEQWRRAYPDIAVVQDARLFAQSFGRILFFVPFCAWALAAVRAAFRVSWGRAAFIFAGGGLIALFVWPALFPVLAFVTASPLLLLLVLFLLVGWGRELIRRENERARFRRTLEAATLNPADASAHYNLGLIHLERGEIEEARRRFAQATAIDPEEIDAHYQLGRIARLQNRLPEAIGHFEQVVARNPEHAQHEVWREIGATYLAAGQFADAREMLARFLARRENDPEGLYLMGRALFGLGRRREALDCMRACIRAVESAPAYKHRTEKRWMAEAKQFLRSQS